MGGVCFAVSLQLELVTELLPVLLDRTTEDELQQFTRYGRAALGLITQVGLLFFLFFSVVVALRHSTSRVLESLLHVAGTDDCACRLSRAERENTKMVMYSLITNE